MLKTKSQRITTAGMLIAAGIILPFAVSHGFGVQGSVLLPMHIPVYIIGFLCGPMYGLLCGILIPILNSVLTGMPALFPNLPMMIGELAVYGLISGLLFNKTKLAEIKLGVYPALLSAMICGRAAYGLIFQILTLANGALKASTVTAALITGIPGIIVQLILIPCVITAVVSHNRSSSADAVASAKNLIAEGTATCVVIKNNRVVKTEYGSGIAPLIAMYESGILEGAYVVDKIVGKAAAMVMALGKVKGCHAGTISEAAVEWISGRNMNVSYDIKTELIKNRKGDDMCPMEKAVQYIDDPEEALKVLKNTLEQLRKSQ